MDLDAYFSSEMEEHEQVLDATREAVREPFARRVAVCQKAARNLDAVAAGVGGRDGGRRRGRAAPLVEVASNGTARIPEMHITLGHMLCGALETELAPP